MAALLTIEALIENGKGFGILDMKGELFERALYLLAAHPDLWDRVVVVDFSNREAITPYNILAPQGDDFDFSIQSRTETLKELLPEHDRLTLRGIGILRNSISLLSELGYPLTKLDELLSDVTLRNRLVRQSRNHAVKYYFQKTYSEESRQSIAAVRARVTALFSSDGVKQSLSGRSSPDFRSLQDQGRIVLINCAGRNISRGTRILLQGIVVSDIRQSIFARENKRPFHWFIDEAQNLFLTKQQSEDVSELLTMSRSFGSYFTLICQNLGTAVRSGEVQELLHTNIRWTFSLRSTPKDCGFLRSALPVSGMMRRTSTSPFQDQRSYYTPEEERRLLHEGIASLPNRVGYLWLKEKSSEAIRLRTRTLTFGRDFSEIVEELRNEPRFGQRISRQDYERLLRSREPERRNIESDLESNYNV